MANQQLVRTMEVAESSILGEEYFIERFHQWAAKHPDAAQLIPYIENHARLVSARLSAGENPWFGQIPSASGFENMQKNIAREALMDLAPIAADPEHHITYNFSIDPVEAQLIRGYASKDPLDETSINALDKLFTSWLSECGYVIGENSIVYEANENGVVQMERGKPVKVNPQTVIHLIEEEYSRFLADRDIQLSVAHHVVDHSVVQKPENNNPVSVVEATEPGREQKNQPNAGV